MPNETLKAVVISVPAAANGLRSWRARITCVPKPKGNSKTVMPDFGSPKCRKCKKYERRRAVPRKQDVAAEKVAAKLLEFVAPPRPFASPVELALQVRLPIMKSWSKKKKAAARAGLHFPCSNKKATGPIPDLGNLEKLLEDALEKGRWLTNDSLIARRTSEKCYSDEPGYRVFITVLKVVSV